MQTMWRLTGGNERGGIFLSGLVLVTIMTLLGIALFDVSRLEGNLTIGDSAYNQVLYCAEAGLGRTMVDKPTAGGGRINDIESDVSTAPGATRSWTDTVAVVGGNCSVTTTFTDDTSVTPPRRLLRAVATGPTGISRSVRVHLTFLAAPFEYAAVSNNGDLLIGGDGTGTPPTSGPGGDDVITGDVFASGRAYVGIPSSSISCSGSCGSVAAPAPKIVPRSTTDSRPTVSLPTGSTWTQAQTDNSSAWPNTSPNDTNPFGYQASMPTPDVSGYVSAVQAVSGNTTAGVYTPGAYSGSPVYNLPAIFAALGRNSSDGSLAVPSGCSSSSRPANAAGNCKLYWDLKQLNLKQNPPDRAAESALTTGDDYYFDGVYQGEIFSSPRTGQRGAQRLVDLNLTGQSAPPIFIGDNIRFSWINPSSEVTYGFAINGRGTFVATNDVLLSDNVIYRDGLNNTDTSTADMIGLVAARDIWYGDPRYGTFYEGSGIMLAGRDFNFVFYDNSGNSRTPDNFITLNGTMLANRQVAVFRDFANPTSGNSSCSSGSTACQPIRFDASDTSCGASTGCWRFILRDSNGNITFDTSKSSFRQCTGSNACASGSRRVTHFQLTLNYDNRLFTTTALVPPGLPTGAGFIFQAWRDWQECPTCN